MFFRKKKQLEDKLNPLLQNLYMKVNAIMKMYTEFTWMEQFQYYVLIATYYCVKHSLNESERKFFKDRLYTSTLFSDMNSPARGQALIEYDRLNRVFCTFMLENGFRNLEPEIDYIFGEVDAAFPELHRSGDTETKNKIIQILSE